VLGFVEQAWLAESPRWLLLSGAGREAAEDALSRARGSPANAAVIDVEVDAMVRSLQSAEAVSSGATGATSLAGRSVRGPQHWLVGQSTRWLAVCSVPMESSGGPWVWLGR
jgi:hypothetical protein